VNKFTIYACFIILLIFILAGLYMADAATVSVDANSRASGVDFGGDPFIAYQYTFGVNATQDSCALVPVPFGALTATVSIQSATLQSGSLDGPGYSILSKPNISSATAMPCDCYFPADATTVIYEYGRKHFYVEPGGYLQVADAAASQTYVTHEITVNFNLGTDPKAKR
jgi:hypothetical protein